MDIVVARYKEDVAWTNQFPRVLIYNKGDPLDNTIPLPNVGKEGHTYYTHICENYDKLADYTAFVQGNPFDHFPNFIEHVQTFMDSDHAPFEPLGTIVFCCNLSGCKFHQDLPLKDVYEHLFGERKEELAFTFYGGAQFIVSKEQIRKRPKSFYQKIVDLLSKEINPLEGFVIERFHHFIFR
jgi:hypothetical protein